MFLKNKENKKHTRLVLEKVYLSKSRIVINKAHIIAIITTGGLGRAPHV
jgi:hypothetical protein